MIANQIMSVTFMVAKKNVLAMHASVILPPSFGLLYGLTFGMIVTSIGNTVAVQVVKYYLLSFHILHNFVF